MRKDGTTPIQRVSIVLPLVLGGLLLGDALLGVGTLDHATTLHRAILEAIGVVLMGFSIFRLVRISKKYKGASNDRT
jgi:hypothetical protein